MATWLKRGVFGDLTWGAADGLRYVERLYARKKKDLYITSIRDGTHSPGSLHPQGDAWDMRKEGVSKKDIVLALGKDFDVVEYKWGFHVELDPK